MKHYVILFFLIASLCVHASKPPPIIAQAKKLASDAAQNTTTPMPIIAIAGGPGAGKTYFTQQFQEILSQEGHSVSIIEQDNFLLYNETGFDVLTDINPRLKWKQLNQTLQEVAARKGNVLLPFRNKTERPFTTEYKTVSFAHTELVLFDGKHALSGPETFNFFSHCTFGIFIDTNIENMASWKEARELARPSQIQKEQELFDKQMLWGLEIYRNYILPTKKNASFVIYHDQTHTISLAKEPNDDQ